MSPYPKGANYEMAKQNKQKQNQGGIGGMMQKAKNSVQDAVMGDQSQQKNKQ
jgi:hypothetical protein